MTFCLPYFLGLYEFEKITLDINFEIMLSLFLDSATSYIGLIAPRNHIPNQFITLCRDLVVTDSRLILWEFERS